MIVQYPFRFSRICTIFLLCLLAWDEPTQAVTISMGSLDVSRILFLGNSITYHGADSSLSWSGNWGMAASTQAQDYVHVLTSTIAARAGNTPSLMITNIASFEKAYGTYDISTNLSAELAFQPTVVVLAIGENVTLSTPEDQSNYADAYLGLITAFKNASSPAIFTRGCFWPNDTKDTIMKNVAEAKGCTFVDISSLYPDYHSVNCAFGDPTSSYYQNWASLGTGVGIHPGNCGMAAIAHALETSMVAASTIPEPGAFILMTIGVTGFVAYGRRRM